MGESEERARQSDRWGWGDVADTQRSSSDDDDGGDDDNETARYTGNIWVGHEKKNLTADQSDTSTS